MNFPRPTRMLAVMVALALPAVIVAPAVAADPTYPPTTQAQVLSSTTTPFQGQTIKVSGLNYFADEDVKLYIGGIYVGVGHTDSAGSFDPPVVVPKTLLGAQELLGEGVSGQPNDRDTLTLTIRKPGKDVGGVTTTNGGGLSSTGVKAAGLTLIAVLLLAAGVAVNAAGRRRRAHG